MCRPPSLSPGGCACQRGARGGASAWWHIECVKWVGEIEIEIFPQLRLLVLIAIITLTLTATSACTLTVTRGRCCAAAALVVDAIVGLGGLFVVIGEVGGGGGVGGPWGVGVVNCDLRPQSEAESV